MKNIKKLINLNNLLLIIGLIVLSFYLIPKNFAHDLFFDIKTGESILKYGIDFKDHFSFIPNLSYLYHHWLYDLGIYFLFKKFSYYGVFYLFLFVSSILSILYYYICKKISNSKLVAILLTILVMFISFYYFETRVLVITYLLLFIEIICLEKIYTGNKKYLVPLLLDAILIVNIHMAIWILAVVFTLPFIAEGLISLLCDHNNKVKKSCKKYINIETPRNYKLLFISFGALLLTGFISPYGTIPYTFFIKAISTNDFTSFEILELKRVTLYNYPYELFLTIILFGTLFIKKFKFKLRDLFMSIGLFILMIIAIRNIVFFNYIIPIVILRAYINGNNKINININSIKKYINIDILKTIVLICMIIILKNCITEFNNEKIDILLKKDYPVDAVKYIKNNLDYKNIKLYNHFSYGGYLEFNDIPVFVDSRAEVYIKKFNGGFDIATDYENSTKQNKYKEIFNKYNFDYALVYKNKSINYILCNDQDYEEIYSDKNYVLYELKK